MISINETENGISKFRDGKFLGFYLKEGAKHSEPRYVYLGDKKELNSFVFAHGGWSNHLDSFTNDGKIEKYDWSPDVGDLISAGGVGIQGDFAGCINTGQKCKLWLQNPARKEIDLLAAACKILDRNVERSAFISREDNNALFGMGGKIEEIVKRMQINYKQ